MSPPQTGHAAGTPSPARPHGLPPQPDHTDLASLAHALTERGHTPHLITAQPYLTLPHTSAPQQIYATGQHFYWAPAHSIAPCTDIGLAADTICWVLRAHP